jgi:hypothetical protein
MTNFAALYFVRLSHPPSRSGARNGENGHSWRSRERDAAVSVTAMTLESPKPPRRTLTRAVTSKAPSWPAWTCCRNGEEVSESVPMPGCRSLRTLTSRLGLIALSLCGVVVLGACGGSSSATSSSATSSSATGVTFSFHGTPALPVLGQSFEFNGSAPPADRMASVSSDGLRIGVRRHQPGIWEGFFAVTRASFAANAVFGVTMYREPGQVAGTNQTGETVFAVQTGDTKRTGDINYVLVASVSNAGRTHWEVGFAEGHIANATTTILWTEPASATADMSEDVTVKTDGHSSLEVHFGQRLVYSSHTLNMHITPPFQAYLEVQALEVPYQARFTNFRVVSG